MLMAVKPDHSDDDWKMDEPLNNQNRSSQNIQTQQENSAQLRVNNQQEKSPRHESELNSNGGNQLQENQNDDPLVC